uniref:Tigger transposable element-derived protein 1-like n=1 Tax=Pelodiscus sinensis TaxID=13735 RepID=K7F172_PELSI|nr:tigger transposable element-derived protein 1-like [Pelodiscus sinensis]|eukprot:XP_006138987.1 tigger transposable element-derived protein 1-like [Pelodiscus sinensis]
MADKQTSKGSDTPERRKRKAINFEMKLDILKRAEKGETQSQIGYAFGLNRSTIATIIKDKARILEHVKGSALMHSTIITKKRSGIISDMEKLLILWLEDQHQRKVPVSVMLIQEKALSLYKDLKKNLGENARDVEPFVASRGWFNRFKARANLHNIKVSGEAASADEKAASAFLETFAATIKEGNYSAHQVFNVEETELFWKKMPERTYISKEEKTMPGFKAAKDHLILLLGGNAAGDFKIKPLLVYHSETPRAFKGVTKAALPVVWKSSHKAWVTLVIFEDWFFHHFVPEVKLYCAKNNIPFRILLVLNHAPGHPVSLDDFHPDIKVVFIPPNTSSLLQPMDQGATRLFKAYYTRRIFAQAIKTIKGEEASTFKDFWRGYNMYAAVKNIGESWHEVMQTSINRIWKKLYPQFVNDFKGFEETLKNVIENIIEMGKELDFDLEVYDVEELLDSHAEDLSNDDLVHLEAQKVAEEEAAALWADTPPSKRFTVKKMSEAFQMIEGAMALFEEQDPNSFRFASVSRAVRNALTCYREIYLEKKVPDFKGTSAISL